MLSIILSYGKFEREEGKIMKKAIITIILASFAALALAVPASPEPTTVNYQDGRSLKVYLRGDENHSWHETEDGLHIKKNVKGKFEYVKAYQQGQLVLSGTIAHDPVLRDSKENNLVLSLPDLENMPVNISVKKTGIAPTLLKSRTSAINLLPSDDPFDHTDFPTLGSRKFLCILVDFPDKHFTHSAVDFDSLFNAKNYTYNSAIGSVNEYYRKTSFGQFDPTFDVVGPVRLDSSWAFYGKDNGDNHDVNVQTFVQHAIYAADSIVDYSDYDLDNDGYVDNIYFIYAGYGQASGAAANTIWPHRWYAYSMDSETLDGKYFGDYSTSNELYGTNGTTRTSIGVICHEFGHVCGLPDFYDTDYSGSGGNTGGLGDWDEMAGGSWNDGGRRPPIFNAWSRTYLNWATPVLLDDLESVTLNSAYTHNEIRYFPAETAGEFFIMENRQQTEFDAAIPGHGLLIFHVDKNSSLWYNNSLNNNPDRQAFDLEEADGYGNLSTGYDNAGDPFPGTSRNTSFTDITNPNALDWANNFSRSPLRSIAENSGVITFLFGDAYIDSPTDITVSTQGFDSVTVSWNLNDDGDSVIVIWAEDTDLGFPENMQAYNIGDAVARGEVVYKGIDTVFYHTGLNQGNLQNYAVFAFNDSAYIYSERNLKEITTNSPPFYSTDFSEGIPEGWVIFDRYGNGTFGVDNPLNRTLASATADNGFIVMDSENAGDVTQIDAELITQSYNFALSRSVVLKFQHRLEVNNITLAHLLYTVNNGKVWYEAARWIADTDDPEFFEIDISPLVSGFNDVKFKFHYRGAKEKYWCIDDFEIYSAMDTGMVAGFYTANVSGSKPLTVEFMNTTQSQPDTVDTYIWEFGDDGEFYYEKEPVHTYTRSGKYTVTLTASKNGKVSNRTKTNYIEVLNDAPVLIDEDRDTLDVKLNSAITYNLNDIFMDPNGDVLSYTWSGAPANLAVGILEDSLLILTPNNNYMGLESLTLTAKDNEDDSLVHVMDIWVSETGISDGLPQNFECSQNYPNPFNPTTTINYQLPSDSKTSLSIYDLSGHKVRTLVSGLQDAGYYTVYFNAADLPSGMYLYRLIAGNEMITKKMVLMK